MHELRKLRKMAGYSSAAAFAEATGLAEKTIYSLEQGTYRGSVRGLGRIVEVLSAGLGWPRARVLEHLIFGPKEVEVE